MRGKTESGFEFEIDVKKLDDMRIVDMIVEISDGNLLLLTPLVSKILGREQKERLYKHLEEPDGRVPSEKLSDEITEILKAGNEGKNSSSLPE